MRASNAFIMVVWTALTLAIDVYASFAFYRQFRTADYAKTSGVVDLNIANTQAHVMHNGSIYIITNAIFKYMYRVDGKRFYSKRFSYFFPTASEIRNSIGFETNVDVFYKHDDPSDAVLCRGVTKRDIKIIEFIGFLNVLLLIGWWVAKKAKPYKKSAVL